jgi:hypothetical protein
LNVIRFPVQRAVSVLQSEAAELITDVESVSVSAAAVLSSLPAFNPAAGPRLYTADGVDQWIGAER